jgi:hypothetical protein
MIIQAYKCPDTGKLFEHEDQFEKHLRSLARTQGRRDREKKVVQDRRSLLAEWRSLKTVDDITAFMVKNFVRLRQQSWTDSRTGSLSSIDVREGMKWRKPEERGPTTDPRAGWHGVWQFYYRTRYHGTLSSIFSMLPGVRGMVLKPTLNQFGAYPPADSDRAQIHLEGEAFPGMLKHEMDETLAEFKALCASDFPKRMVRAHTMLLQIETARQKNDLLKRRSSHKLFSPLVDEIELTGQLFPEFDTYFSVAAPREQVMKALSEFKVIAIPSSGPNKSQRHYITDIDTAVWLNMAGAIPPNAPLLSINGPRAYEDDCPF